MKFFYRFYQQMMRIHKLLLCVIFLFTALTIELYRDFMPDDTFIHIGYAKDVSEGKGFSFTGAKTYGSTSPIWPLIIAALLQLHVPLEMSARIASFIFSLASILLMFSLARTLWNELMACMIAGLFCFNAYFMRWSLSGMESSASCLFMLLMMYVLFKEKNNAIRTPFYVLIGIAPLVRPEFYLFIILYFLFISNAYPPRNLVIKLVSASIPAVLWNCFALWYYGTMIPSTFSAKAADVFFSTEWSTIVRSLQLFLSGNFIEWCTIMSIAVLMVWRKRSVGKIELVRMFRSEEFLMILWIGSFYIYYILKNVTILSRYSLMLLPLIMYLMIVMLTKVRTEYGFSKKKFEILAGSLIILALVIHGAFTCIIIKPDADSCVNGFQREYKKIAGIISLDPSPLKSVMLSDVGIIGVYSHARVYDFVGIVDHDRSNYSTKRAYFLDKRPDYLISRGELNLQALEDSSCSFEKIYSTQFPGIGINHTGNFDLHVFKVLWNN